MSKHTILLPIGFPALCISFRLIWAKYLYYAPQKIKDFFQTTASDTYATEHQKEKSFKYKVLSAWYGNIIFAITYNFQESCRRCYWIMCACYMLV